MKKLFFFKTMVLLLAIVTFSNCEENGALQFVVADDFEISVRITGLDASSSYSTSGTVNISDLLDNADVFVDSNIEEISLTLQDDYSGTSISGSFQIQIGTIDVTETLTLSKGQEVEVNVPDASSILSLLTSGSFPYNFNVNLSSPVADDDFTINVKYRVKATVE